MKRTKISKPFSYGINENGLSFDDITWDDISFEMGDVVIKGEYYGTEKEFYDAIDNGEFPLLDEEIDDEINGEVEDSMPYGDEFDEMGYTAYGESKNRIRKPIITETSFKFRNDANGYKKGDVIAADVVGWNRHEWKLRVFHTDDTIDVMKDDVEMLNTNR
jgi:hypothetical protein